MTIALMLRVKERIHNITTNFAHCTVYNAC